MWRWLPEIRPDERPRVLLFAGTAAGINLAQTVGLAGAEAILLGRLGAGALPPVFVVAALVTVAGMLSYSGVVGAARNDRLMASLLGIAALTVAVGFAAVRMPWSFVPPALLCAWFLAQAVLLNHLFTFAADYFDTLASKRVIPVFAVGGSLGGAAGGGAAAVLAGIAAPELLVAAWALLLLATALWVVAFRTRLARWRALALDEEDDTSLEGLAVSWRYARRSRLSRWLAASVVAMVLALFVSQYLYSEIFVESFGTTEKLAVFLGIYLALSNLLEIVVEVALTPWLIRRYGVASANVVHASATLLSFLALALAFRLPAALLARLNREMLDQGLGQPVRNLVYNALPMRVRGKMRALLEGMVLYSGMAGAGALLLLVPAPDPRALVFLGILLALLYLAATLCARRAYVESLLSQLREGRLDLADLEEGLGATELARLGSLWSELLASGRAAADAAELAPRLAARGVLEPLESGATHADAGVRRACVAALASVPGARPRQILRGALADPDAEVRRLALVGLGEGAEPGDLARGLADADPRVQAEAAAGLGPEGAARLAEMAASPDPAVRCAALAALPAERAELAAARASDAEPRVRAAALAALARVGPSGGTSREALAAALEDADAGVREAAVDAAEALLGAEAWELLAGRLGDPAPRVRQRAARALARGGDAALRWTAPALAGEPPASAAAAQALGAAGTPGARAALQQALRARVDTAWGHALALRALGDPPPEGFAGLAAAHADALLRQVRMAFRILRQLESARAVLHVERALRLGSPRQRADALEALSNLGDRRAAGALALLLEPAPLAEKRPPPGLQEAPRSPDQALAAALRAEDRWVRLAAEEAAGRVPPEERIVDRLLALRRVPLFAQLGLDQLESLNRAMQVEPYTRGEVVVREGERGDRLFLLLEGEVEIWAGWETEKPLLLNRLQPVSAFGERAVLHDELRTATAITTRESLLASLSGEQMKELIRRMPEMSFAIIRELIDRARVAEDRLRQQSDERGP